MSGEARDPAAALVSDAREGIAAAIADEAAALRPDFAAIVEELRRRGHAVPASAAEVLDDEVDDEVEDGDAALALALADDGLAALLGDARQTIDADRAARRLLPLPPPPPLRATSPARAGSRRLVGALAALGVAAAIALLWGAGPHLARPLGGADPRGSQAAYRDHSDDAVQGATARGDAAAPGRRRLKGLREVFQGSGAHGQDREDMFVETGLLDASGEPPAPAEPALAGPGAGDEADAGAASAGPGIDVDAVAAGAADVDEDADAVAPGAADVDEDEREARGAAAAEARPARPREAEPSPPRTRDRALEAEAEARWRAGDLVGAERALRAIIRAGGDRRRVDLAYGDLFTVTRQLHGREREAAVWGEYLRRFPRGHYADDARAGLCRRAEGAARGACWQRYLADFPRGSHRAEAGRDPGEP